MKLVANQDERNVSITIIAIFCMLFITNLITFFRTVKIQQDINSILESNSLKGSTIPIGSLTVGSIAPDFTKTTIDGKEISLHDYEGNVILLSFISTTCPACQAMFPNLKDFLQNETIQTIMIAMGTENEVDQIIKQYGFNFPVFIADEDILRDYKVNGVPFFYVVNESGIIENGNFANSLTDINELLYKK